jgi:hypothetical protein
VNRRHLSAHRTPEGAGRRLAEFWRDGPTPWTAHLYSNGGPAPRADARVALDAAAREVLRGTP